MIATDDASEWLETDGLGGFASGTVSGIRTRRYHALLLTATTPPVGRVALVNGFDAHVDTPSASFALTTQRYAPDVRHPDGATRIATFFLDPWPTWQFDGPDGTRLSQEIFVQRGTGRTVVVWTRLDGGPAIDLRVRPFLSGRDYHALHRENGAFRFDRMGTSAVIAFRPYDGLPGVLMLANGDYQHAPDWYRNFLYSVERERGLDCIEDLAAPGVLTWRLTRQGEEAIWILRADGSTEACTSDDVVRLYRDIRRGELERRAAFKTPLDRAADAYLVRRGAGRTIVAGYPWFTDWGRDTFIAIRGLCLAAGRLDAAREILVEWAGAVSDGMLPNRFPDRGEAPEFNAVDASLWYVIAASELLALTGSGSTPQPDPDRAALEAAILRIVSGYAAGTRYGIRMDDDGLLAAGIGGVQLTWMDARVGGRVITPRIGKPVEIQALWLNALQTAASLDPRWSDPFERGRASFAARFWNEQRGHLADVVDVDHVRGTRDDTFRPNQILAVGGLPLALLEGERARRMVDAVEQKLVTPLGLRSLAPDEPGYAGRYEGDSSARDAVYHQGTVWPWLIGPFVDAWLRVHGDTPPTRREARARFVDPLRAHLERAGVGHVSEIADADDPFTPRGCPFQAWSLGEFIRAEIAVSEPAQRDAAGWIAAPVAASA